MEDFWAAARSSPLDVALTKMDAETLKLLQKAIHEGITSASWALLIVAVVAAGLGAFFGSYLKRKGEDTAIRENFTEVLKQLKAQTEVTETIKHKFEVELEKMKSLQTQDVFVRELYASGIREYSSEQAYALRQAYLLLFEPLSSAVNSAGKDLEERMDMAIQSVMQPLRKHVGLLDESTIENIYDVQKWLLELKGKAPEELKKSKNDLFNVIDMARQFVKADQIAFRLGLIHRPLANRRPGEE